MSRKQQFKDALKRKKQTIMRLTCDIKELRKALFSAEIALTEFKYANKKWWQFWK